LHELAHAWLHQYKQEKYDQWDSCPLAEAFACASYDALGGTRAESDLCSTHRLNIVLADERLDNYAKLAASLVRDPLGFLEK
jgi:hypothetical protein